MNTKATHKKEASVEHFLMGVTNARRRADGQTVLEMMRAVAGEEPRMWGSSIIGFGTSTYELANGKTDKIFKIGFSPRASSLVLYLGKFPAKEALLAKLGKHKRGASCIYINKLADIDAAILQEMFRKAYQ